MVDRIRALLVKHKSVLLYLVFGVVSTIVNYVVYLASMWAMSPWKFANVASTIIAWVLAVMVAYLTNSRWVFESKASDKAAKTKELVSFYMGRVATGVLDLGVMFVAVDLMGLNGAIVKLLSNVIVIVLNYFISKFIVFKK